MRKFAISALKSTLQTQLLSSIRKITNKSKVIYYFRTSKCIVLRDSDFSFVCILLDTQLILPFGSFTFKVSVTDAVNLA